MSNLDYEQKLKTYLLIVGQQSASDLHLVVGRYPTIRIDGKLIPLTQEQILTPADMIGLSNAMLDEKGKKRFCSRTADRFFL